jgi:general secretion pathway protein H
MDTRTEVRSPGFTLLELIVVLFVLALGAALAAPSIGRSTDSIKARAEIAGFSAMFRHGREMAITSGRSHAVVVDPPARRVSVVVGEDVKRTRAIPQGWTIDAEPPGNLTVRFEPQGSSNGGDYRIRTAGIGYRVTVDPLTGRVRSTRQ